MKKIENYINGEFVLPRSGHYLDNVCPATGEVYALTPDSDATDIDAAVSSAQEAYKTWKYVDSKKRYVILNEIANLIERDADMLAAAESEDQGKPVSLARSVDIPRAAANFRFFAGAILHTSESTFSMGEEGFNYTDKSPIGVAGLISPWNLPLYLLTWKIAPALATGNTVVCKPSEITPMTAYLLSKIIDESSLPKGVCHIVHGLGAKSGRALTSHKGVPMISFTGGTATAEHVIKDSAPYFKKLSLELGGKNPNIIFADADLKACLETTVRSSFSNQGEICLCGSRIFVEESIFEEFSIEFGRATSNLVVGDPRDPNSNLGAVASEAHKEKILSYIDLAKQEGGDIVAGGKSVKVEGRCENGFFVQPTVIKNLDPCGRVMQEEIFGPVVTLTPFKTEEDVLQMANGTQYGLSATVWTSDLKRAHRVSRELDVGQVWVNAWMKRDLRVPFGGSKASGIGREGGKYSLDFFTEAKNIYIDLL